MPSTRFASRSSRKEESLISSDSQICFKVEDSDGETGICKEEISISIELDTSMEKNDDSDENCSEENTSVKEIVDRKDGDNKHKFICDVCGVFCKSKLKSLITVLLQKSKTNTFRVFNLREMNTEHGWYPLQANSTYKFTR